LALEIEYILSDEGLSVLTSAHNRGAQALPYGVGFHPYLTVAGGRIDASTLRLPARRVLDVDERLIPTGNERDVDGTDIDFREDRAIGTQTLDPCFTDLVRDVDGLARAVLYAADGRRSVTLWLDQSFHYLQVFSGDTLAAERRRCGLALEPMTCPPNA